MELPATTRTERTRLLLMRAAEGLILEKGVDNWSLREVAERAGQRNPSAAIYHFGDRRTLIEAVLLRHSMPIQDGWIATLQRADRERALSLVELVELLVRPIADKLDDADGGLAYLTLCAELLTNKAIPLTDTQVSRAEGANELARRMMALAEQSSPLLLAMRMMRIASMLYGSIYEYARLTKQGFDLPREEFLVDLINAITSTLVPTSTSRVPRAATRPRGRRPIRPRT